TGKVLNSRLVGKIFGGKNLIWNFYLGVISPSYVIYRCAAIFFSWYEHGLTVFNIIGFAISVMIVCFITVKFKYLIDNKDDPTIGIKIETEQGQLVVVFNKRYIE